MNAEKTEENDDDDTQSQASDETEIFTGEEQLTAEQQQALLAEQNGEMEQDQTENGWPNMYNNQQNFGFDNTAANYQGMDYNAQQMMMQQMMLQMQQNGGYPNMMGERLFSVRTQISANFQRRAWNAHGYVSYVWRLRNARHEPGHDERHDEQYDGNGHGFLQRRIWQFVE